MKPKLTIWNVLTLLAVVLPTVYLACTWSALPAQIPTHFGIDGEADGFTAKKNMWVLCLALPLGTYLLMRFLPQLDPKQQLNDGTVNYQKLQLALVALMSCISLVSLYTALHPGVQFSRALLVLVGLFIAALGNYLTTVQPNYFVGFKTPWALEFPRIWARTHRLGGWLFFTIGMLSALLALVWSAPVATTVLTVGLLGATVVIYRYSYQLYRREVKAAAAGH